MPTTSIDIFTGCVTELGVGPGSVSQPNASVNSMFCPRAPYMVEKPRAVASVLVKRISCAASEDGRRPAATGMAALDWPRGGIDTRAPHVGGSGVAAGVDGADDDAGGATRLNVPLMVISPHAARTCGSAPSVVTVPGSNAVVLASVAGATAIWCSGLFASAGALSAP